MENMLLEVLGGERRVARQGYELRLLTAREMLQARYEAENMGNDPETVGLRHNAAVLSRAAVRGRTPVFASAEGLLEQWSAEEIAREMQAYRRMAERVSPDLGDEKTLEALRQQLSEMPEERIRWKVLKAFGVLPSEDRAGEMTWGDYLYCALQMMEDREEQLDRLCPQCRGRAEQQRCSLCGREICREGDKNPAFDESRFEEMKTGG